MVEITAFRLESKSCKGFFFQINFPPMRALEFLTGHHGRQKVQNYFLLLLCKSSIWFTEQHIFKIIIYFFNTSKFATNYVISFEIYDGSIGQKILKLWRQESWPFGPGWAANITSICSWTFRLPCRSHVYNLAYTNLTDNSQPNNRFSD